MKNRKKDLSGIDFNKSRKDDLAYGRSLRKKCPRGCHAAVDICDRDPVTIHLESTEGRIAELTPIRFERILGSPFAHYRGATSIMAYDLSKQKTTSIDVQICGDCHLLNFGGFATPERRIIFDINDFDETIVGPWEWDLKRLAASFMIAAKEKKLTLAECKNIVNAALKSYIENMEQYSKMSALQVWYEDISFEDMIDEQHESLIKEVAKRKLEKKLEQTPHEKEFFKMAQENDGKYTIKDNPPLIYHLEENKQKVFLDRAYDAFRRYRESLPNDKKVLLENYKIHDVAMKVVGVSSVGTWCGIYLLLSDSGDPLFLQFKQAYASVLESFTTPSKYHDHGQRVVEGQKIMQSASDIFLGWTSDEDGRSYYIRQLRDATIKPDYTIMDFKGFKHYARSCGHALAQAHARSGKSAVITGYIGKSDKFLTAMLEFAQKYEHQNKIDFKKLKSQKDKVLTKSAVIDWNFNITDLIVVNTPFVKISKFVLSTI